MTNQANPTDRPIDPALVAELVRKVIARLPSVTPINPHVNPAIHPPTDPHPNRRLVTLETIARHQGPRMRVDKSAVVTPAARDEARRLGIVIERGGESNPNEPNPNEPSGSGSRGIQTVETSGETSRSTNRSTNRATGIVDGGHPERAAAVEHQLGRRGIDIGSATIILSDTPALELYEQIRGGRRAVMITAIADVGRFAAELHPNVWVLDMQRLNIPAAVNTAAFIAQQGADSE